MGHEPSDRLGGRLLVERLWRNWQPAAAEPNLCSTLASHLPAPLQRPYGTASVEHSVVAGKSTHLSLTQLQRTRWGGWSPQAASALGAACASPAAPSCTQAALRLAAFADGRVACPLRGEKGGWRRSTHCGLLASARGRPPDDALARGPSSPGTPLCHPHQRRTCQARCSRQSRACTRHRQLRSGPYQERLQGEGHAGACSLRTTQDGDPLAAALLSDSQMSSTQRWHGPGGQVLAVHRGCSAQGSGLAMGPRSFAYMRLRAAADGANAP